MERSKADKEALIDQLTALYNRWEEFLAAKSEMEINTPQPATGLSIKDVIGHLRAWQQRSIAHLEGALANTHPRFPEWSAKMRPDDEGNVDEYNSVIYNTYKDQPWSQVHDVWSAGFLHFVELARATDAESLFALSKYPWLPGYSLADVLTSSWEHHSEHLDGLLA